MDLEQLTKHQIMLLTLLVSFVTSIATGIVTVSLMNQAPPAISRTINQIVEHTVQTVVPSSAGPVTTTVKTVVVKDDDLVAQSIASLQKSIIRITGKGSDTLIARGIIIDAQGTALTDGDALANASADSFEAILPDGTRVPLTVQKSTSTSTPIVKVSVAVGTSTAFAPAPLADPSSLKLGESVLRIGGSGADIVGEGVIATLPTAGESSIDTTVESSTPGSIVTTLFGEVIGMTTSDSLANSADTYTIIPAIETKSTPKP